MSWTGAAGDGQWHTPANWSTAAVPSAVEDVLIDASIAAVVTIDTAPALAGTLTIGEATGGAQQVLVVRQTISLSAGGTVHVNGTIELNSGGRITGANLTVDAGRMDWLGGLCRPPLGLPPARRHCETALS
jgi:hypothetical protein